MHNRICKLIPLFLLIFFISKETFAVSIGDLVGETANYYKVYTQLGGTRFFNYENGN